jgi:hypothetical protein
MTEKSLRRTTTTVVGPNLSELPVRVDREMGAKLLTQFFFRVSPRSLERWPVAWRLLNGRSHADTAELFTHAASMVDEAPLIMSGGTAKSRPTNSVP